LATNFRKAYHCKSACRPFYFVTLSRL
jgi:hypothetical protein